MSFRAAHIVAEFFPFFLEFFNLAPPCQPPPRPSSCRSRCLSIAPPTFHTWRTVQCFPPVSCEAESPSWPCPRSLVNSSLAFECSPSHSFCAAWSTYVAGVARPRFASTAFCGSPTYAPPFYVSGHAPHCLARLDSVRILQENQRLSQDLPPL